MHLVRNRKYFGSMTWVPMTTFALICNDEQNPTSDQQENRNVTVIDEETGLPRSLESPIHCISTEQNPSRMNLLCISNLVFNCWRYESFSLV